MPRVVTKTLAPLLVIGSCALFGCANNALDVGVTTRAESYVEIDDRLEMLRSKPAKCAALPTIMTGVSEGRGIAADLAVDLALKRDPQGQTDSDDSDSVPMNVLKHQEVLAMCVAAGRFGMLRSLLQSLQPGNMLEPKSLTELGNLLDVEYLLSPQVVSITTDNATRFSFAGFTFIMNGWITIEATLQLWHAPTGMLVWQSAGQGSLTTENLAGYPPPTQAALNELFATLVGDFISGRRETVVKGRVAASPVTTQTNTKRGAGGTQTSTSTIKTVETVETIKSSKDDSVTKTAPKTPSAGATNQASSGSDS